MKQQKNKNKKLRCKWNIYETVTTAYSVSCRPISIQIQRKIKIDLPNVSLALIHFYLLSMCRSVYAIKDFAWNLNWKEKKNPAASVIATPLLVWAPLCASEASDAYILMMIANAGTHCVSVFNVFTVYVILCMK